MKTLEINLNKIIDSNLLDRELSNTLSGYTHFMTIGDKIRLFGVDESDSDLVSNIIIEHKLDDETLVSKIAKENGLQFYRDIDVPLDKCEFFKPKEKVYNLAGEPQFKDYIHINSLGEEILVCRIEYHKIYEDIEKNTIINESEFVGGKTIFKFYIDSTRYKTKEVESLPFNLTSTEILSGETVIGYLYSSVKREEILKNERYKSEQLMKTFNPPLYKMFTQVFNNEYSYYKETGVKDDLVNSLLNCEIPEINNKLNEQVTDEDKRSIFGDINPLPSLTILEMILNSLQ